MNNTSNLGLQINMQQILNLLSSSLYKGDVLQVATRELLQNSFDAVKKVSNPAIDVTFDDYKRKLTFKDNGCGMSPQTVKDVFFTVGGTLKEGLDETERSGGFGIAKVQFFMAAELIEVSSVRDGIMTKVIATQSELLAGAGHIQSYPTDESSGTTVILTFPESYENEKGDKQHLYYYESSVIRALQKPLIGYNIPIRFNNMNVRLEKCYSHCVTKEYDFGVVQLYYSPTLRDSSYAKYDVHCAGLFQFSKSEYLGGNMGIEFTMNILPKFTAGRREYPFANSRDDFSGYCKPKIDEIMKVVKDLARFLYQEKIANEYACFAQLEYISVDGKMYRRDIVGHSNDRTDIAVALAHILSVDALAEMLIKAIKDQDERRKADRESKEANKESSLKFINKTNRVFTHSEHEMFSKIASIVYDVICTTEVKQAFKLNVATCGVIIQDGLAGCCLTLDGVSGIYLNPIGIFHNANHFANKMIETLIHELGHTGRWCDSHNDDFFKNQARMRELMWRFDLYETIYSKFVNIYLQYND